MSKISILDDEINKFITYLLSKDSKSINKETKRPYIEAIRAAKDYCVEKFTDWGNTKDHFPSHGIDHAGRVLQYCLSMAKRSRPRSFNFYELYALGISAILHDIGMTAELPKEILSVYEENHERARQRRLRHGEATAELIKSCRDDKLHKIRDANPEFYDQFLPIVCAAHTTSGFKANIEILKSKTDMAGSNRYITIAGVLLIADELDISRNRAKPDRGHYSEFTCDSTKAHWWKHWLVLRADFEGNTFKIIHISRSKFPYASDFAEWTLAKIKTQLSMIVTEINPDRTSNIWKITPIVEECDIDEAFDFKGYECTAEIRATVLEEKNKLEGSNRNKPILNPLRPILFNQRREEFEEASQFFKKTIGDNITVFRGQGQHIDNKDAFDRYVRIRPNISLLEQEVNRSIKYIESPVGVCLKLFTGKVGVGKTHFLSVFLHELKKNYSEFQRLISVRAELTHCENKMGCIKEKISLAIYQELVEKNMLQPIADAMEILTDIKYRFAMPLSQTDILSWDEQKNDQFISLISSICSDSDFKRFLGERAPLGVSFFIDNLDHLEDYIIEDIYDYCYNLSGKFKVIIWILMRPETYSYLKKISPDHSTMRSPEVIKSPTLKDVVLKRISCLEKMIKKKQFIDIKQDLKFCTDDIVSSLSYIASLTLETTSDMLPSLANMADGKSSSDIDYNIRAGLEGLVGILGSHILTDNDYMEAHLERVSQISSKSTKFASKKWSKVFEALLLHQRLWYKPDYGPVENLFDHPHMELASEYFLLVHCLQILIHYQKPISVEEMTKIGLQIGYNENRIPEAIRHLATRRFLIKEDVRLYDRSSPLIAFENNDFNSAEYPYPKNAKVILTPWGRYHIQRIIFQAQYWKHVYYQLLLPKKVFEELNDSYMHYPQNEKRVLKNLNLIFGYLKNVEDSWKSYDTKQHGVKPIIRNIQAMVNKQWS